MNPDLDRLHPYPFERLRALFADLQPTPALEPIRLSVGEPQHPPPEAVQAVLAESLAGLARYPSTRGQRDLREAIAGWLQRRYGLSAALDPERHVLPVNGTREALFALAQVVVDREPGAVVLLPNPFYQIYEGAALLAGAEPWYLDTPVEQDFLPDLESVPRILWERCRLLYLCSPGNPHGAVMSRAQWQTAIELAHRYDFVIAADECYAELYREGSEPPPGILEAADALGLTHYDRCIAFHSLSKRSNLPGLRSGFVAGDPEVLARFHTYRTYQGCALPPPVQAASRAAWLDEDHVRTNRERYRAKFDAVVPILQEVLDVAVPAAGFYLWPEVPRGDDTGFARGLYAQKHVTVVPGRFLARAQPHGDPGRGRVRIALVDDEARCRQAAERIRDFVHRV